MAYSYKSYLGDGTTKQFSFDFPYISTTHLKVFVDGVETTAYTLTGSFEITFDTAPANGVVVKITRETPKDEPLVDYIEGSTLLEGQLDLEATQSLYVVQEAFDAVDNTIALNNVSEWDAKNFKIINVADGSVDTDAANMSQLNDTLVVAQSLLDDTEDALAASVVAQLAAESAQAATAILKSDTETIKGQAETARDAAQTAQANAETALSDTNTAKSLAQAYANAAEDVEVETGLYSAKHWSAKAEATVAAGVTDGSVTTPKLADNAVTLAKMAGGTAGKLIGFDGSGNPAEVEASGGAWELLATATADDSASVEFINGVGGVVFDDTYDDYIIIGSDITTAETNRQVMTRLSSDGGASYDSGASDYDYVHIWAISTGSSVSFTASTGADNCRISPSGTWNTAGLSFNFTMHVHSPSNSSLYTLLGGDVHRCSSGGQPITSSFTGRRTSVGAHDAIQILFHSGNILSGTFKLYGIKKA